MFPTIDSFYFVSEVHWNSAYYGTMAAASSAVESVQKKAKEIAFPVALWNLSRKLRDMAELIENPQKHKPAPSGERVDVHKVVQQFETMLSTIDNFYAKCQRLGYTNRTLTAGQLASIYRHNEIVREFTEHVKLIIDPRTEEVFRTARENRQIHGTVPMSSIF
jgi:hypothetical protein